MPSGKGRRGGNATAKKSNRASKPRKPAAASGGRKKVSKGSSFAETGANLGSQVGGMLGRMGAGLISRITGFGSYEISKNSISNGNAVASFYNDGDGVVVCHREYLADLSGSTAFSINSMPVNPGIQSSFPWLSQIANQFEEYEMLGLVYEFRPLSGMAVSTSSASLGAVIYATDYNPYNPTFPNKQTMESYEFATSTVPFNEMLHPVECKPGSAVLTKKFVRSGAVTTGTLQLYDLGNFEYATQGMQSAYVVGELWVSYHVRLSKPRLDLTPYEGSCRIVSTPPFTAGVSSVQGTSGWAFAGPQLGGVSFVYSSGIPGRPIQISNVGYYFVVANFANQLVTGVAGGPVLVTGTNIIGNPFVFWTGGASSPSLSSGSGTVGQSVYYLQVVTAGNSVENQINLTNSGAANATTSVFICRLTGPPPF